MAEKWSRIDIPIDDQSIALPKFTRTLQGGERNATNSLYTQTAEWNLETAVKDMKKKLDQRKKFCYIKSL